MSKRILGLAALLCAVLLASTVSAGSPGASHVSRARQVIRAQPRMLDATRVRTQRTRAHEVRSAVRAPSSRVVRAAAGVSTRSATGRRPQTRVTPLERNWVRCAQPSDHCNRIGRAARFQR